MPRRRRPRGGRPALVLIAAASLGGGLLAGCGSSQPPSDREQVTATLRTFLRAQSDGAGEQACAALAPAAQRQLVRFVTRRAGALGVAPTTCADAATLVHVVAPRALLQALRAARITRLAVRGSAATATVSDGASFPPQRVVLTRTGGRWLIARVPSLIGG